MKSVRYLSCRALKYYFSLTVIKHTAAHKMCVSFTATTGAIVL
jgi:hypothetical protein